MTEEPIYSEDFGCWVWHADGIDVQIAGSGAAPDPQASRWADEVMADPARWTGVAVNHLEAYLRDGGHWQLRTVAVGETLRLTFDLESSRNRRAHRYVSFAVDFSRSDEPLVRELSIVFD